MLIFIFRKLNNRQQGLLGRFVCDDQHAGTELVWKKGAISKSGFTLSNSTDVGQGVGEGVGSVFAEHTK